jgi:type IV pilus assembly protein PilA
MWRVPWRTEAPGEPEHDIMNLTRKDGFTLIELLFVAAVIGILSAIAAPALSRTKLAANEASAMATLRAVNSGQQMFWASCGSGNYATSLQDLGHGPAGQAGFLSADLVASPPVVKSGYEIDLASNTDVIPNMQSCVGDALVSAYHATADPLPGKGRRYFGTNTAGGIFQSTGTLFTDMPDAGAPPAPAVAIQQ